MNIAAFFLLVCAAFAQAKTIPNVEKVSLMSVEHVGIFNASLKQPSPARAVWFGDSITIGFPDQAPQLWNDKYANLPSQNFAVGGHNVNNQIQRIVNEGVLQGHNAKIAVVKIGTNNLWDGMLPVQVQEVAAQIRTLVNEILQRQPIIKVLLLGILPRNGAGIAARAEDVNAIIAGYDDGNRVRFLNMRDSFQLQLGVVRPELFYDGLHLNRAGYQVWSDRMDTLFQQLINS